MRECRTYGSVRGALGNERPYRAYMAAREGPESGGKRPFPGEPVDLESALFSTPESEAPERDAITITAPSSTMRKRQEFFRKLRE